MIKNKIFTIKYFTRLQPILENEDSEEEKKHDEKLLQEELQFTNNDNYTFTEETSWNCCRYFCYFLWF